jgi:hypothetical protein
MSKVLVMVTVRATSNQNGDVEVTPSARHSASCHAITQGFHWLKIVSIGSIIPHHD